MGNVKTTLEISESTFRRAKTFAAARGITLRQLFTEALDEKLRRSHKSKETTEPPWMKGFGQLADLEAESRKIMKAVEEEFERIEPEDAE